jgi:hypothetical protein
MEVPITWSLAIMGAILVICGVASGWGKGKGLEKREEGSD